MPKQERVSFQCVFSQRNYMQMCMDTIKANLQLLKSKHKTGNFHTNCQVTPQKAGSGWAQARAPLLCIYVRCSHLLTFYSLNLWPLFSVKLAHVPLSQPRLCSSTPQGPGLTSLVLFVFPPTLTFSQYNILMSLSRPLFKWLRLM